MLLTSPTSTQLKGDRPTDQALVILDASVDYLPQLLADLSSVDWLVLDASADGITQITAALQARQSVSSLHIVSHGTAGGLQLGSSQLSLATISHYTQQLQTWATVLQGRDILLYGCQVAQGALGQLFLQQLHQLTGANLAASAQRVGQTADQTNWMLETQLGQVKTPLIFSETLQASYPGHFETVNFSVSTNTLIESEGTPFSFNFTVDGPIPPGGSVVRFEADRPNAISQWNLFALEFTGLAGQPVDVSPNLDFSAFEVTIIAPTASVSLPVFNDFTPEGPDVYTWTASAVSPGTTVNPVGSTTTTIFDDPSQVAPPPPPANTAPVADSDSYATDFDTALTIDAGNGVLNGDTDADGDALTAALISGPSSGSVTLNSDGSFTYTPNAGFSGDDSFTYQANDGTDDSSPATVTVSVGAPPALPEVSLTSDITTLVEDEGTEVTFTISLSEPPPASGLLVDIGTGETFALGDFDIFAPPPQASATGGQLVGGFPDNSGFTFAVLEQTATVTLPVFDDPDRTEDGTVTDPDGPLRNDDIGEEQMTFSVLPREGYTISSGASSVTLTLRDTNAPPPPENTAPVADDDSYSTAFATPLTVDASSGVLDGDTDADGDTLTAAIATDPTGGTVALSDDGSFTYTPNAGFSGDDSFTYTVSDGEGGTDTATVTVTVGDEPPPENTAPVADDDSYTTAFATPLTVDAASGVLDGDTDADGDALTAAIATDPTGGTVALSDDGSFTYTPNAGFSGDDSFTYTVSDGEGGTDTATVTVTVGDEPPPENTAPVADDDSYTTAFATPLTVDAASGVLDGDTDADGDALTAAIATDPTGGTVTLSDDGSFTYTPNAGFSGDDSFTYTVSDGEGGTDTATVSVTVGDEPPPDELLVGISASPTALVEEAGTVTTLTFSLSGAPPTEGINVTIDSDIPGSLAEFDVGAAVFTGAQLVSANADSSGFTINITDPTATIALPVFDDDLDEGVEAITYTLQAGDGYAVDSAASAVTLSIEDADGTTGGGDAPVVSFSTTPELISEADGTALVLNFSVDGEIPAGGITVNLAGDTAEILQQFLAPDGDGAVQTRVTEEGNILYRFDTSFEADNENFANVVGGTLEVFALEDGDPAEDNSDPAAAGTGFLSNFSFTITEPTASITLPVSDDLVQEVDQTFTYTLAAGDGYTVDPAASSGTFTVTDGVTPATSPTVGVTATPTTLVESEQTVIEVTFTTEGDIPAEGLVVQLQGPPRAIAEFDVNATNPRLPEDETVVEGVVVTGGNVVGTDEVAGSLFLRITDPTATVTVPVFQDDVAEGTEVLPFELIDGEAYEVDPVASAVEVTIEDGTTGGGDVPVLSFTATPEVLNEAEGTALTLNFSVEGDFPEEGVVVRFDENFFDTGDQIDFNVFDLENLEFFDFEETSPGLFTVDYLLSAPEGSLTTAVFDDNVAEADFIYNPSILPIPDANYTINPDASSVSILVIDGVEGVGGPVVSLAVDNPDVNEGDALTISLTADGELPEGGIEVLIDSDTGAAIGEFITIDENGIPNATLTGIEGLPAPNGDASGFTVTMVENTATISIDSIFDDGPTEGSEVFEFSVADGENYDIDPATNAITITLNDGGEDAVFGVESGVTSVFLDLPLLEEAAGLTLVGVDSDATPFSEDFQVGFAITDDTDFTFAPVPFTPLGGSIEHDGTLTLGLGGAQATIGEFSIGFDPSRVTDTASGFFVADTLDDPLGLEVLFDISNPGTVSVSSDEFEISDADLLLASELATALGLPDLAGADVGDARIDALLEDGTTGGGDAPVVSFSTTPELISEADGTSLVLNFSVDGEIPAGGITVNLVGDTAEILQQFLAPDGDGAVQTRVTEEGNILYRFDTSFEADNENFANVVGGTLDVFALEDGDPAEDNSDPAAAGTGFLSNFSFTITESTASITLPVSDNLVQEVDQTFTYTLAAGDGYTVDPAASSGTFTVTDGVTPATSPTVGVTATPTTLVESDQTVIELTFTTTGDIPAEGLVVQLQGPPRAIAEFDVNATNPRLPEDETVVEGVVVTGGNIVGTDEVAGSLFLRITDPTATVTVPVFQDDVAEGTEVLPFELIDGEAYEVDPAASTLEVTIEDGTTGGGGELSGLGGQVQFDVAAGEVVTITDFGGVGLGSLPGDPIIDELDTIKFMGAGLTPENLRLTQAGEDLEITFVGDATGTQVVLEDFALDNLDNLLEQTGGSVDRGNILFDGEADFADSFDVFNADSTQSDLWNRDTVTFLNDLDNTVQGFNSSNDVINGLGGDDILSGLSGDDFLNGGDGDDTYTGGSGADQFVFGLGQGVDTVTDFEVGVDTISLGGLTSEGVRLLESGDNTLVLTQSNELLGALQGVTGLDSAIFA